MAFMRTKFGDNVPAGKLGRTSSTSAAIIRWAVVPGAGVALSLWIVAGMAGAYSASSSLSSPTTFMPQPPREAGLGTTVKSEKGRRLIEVAAAGSDGHAHSATVSAGERFEAVVASAALSPQKLAAAFAKSGMAVARHQPAKTPLKERFDVATAAEPHGPEQARFGQRSEAERSSRLALALAGSAGIELAYAVAAAPGSDAAVSGLFVSPEGMLGSEDDNDDVAVFDDLPDNMPLPARRPRIDDSPVDKPERPPAPRVASTPKQPAAPKPAKRDDGEMLAFAKPDDPRESHGLFSSLFSRSAPRASAGVAVYDISAATVTMPDGTRLEAHSGVGHMADNVKYVDRKMVGPTPPGTYKLTMRESRFHGVEAIRLTPVDGRNPYGRNGLLAHTEMLRGRPQQSNGCVAFKDYQRFLAAFKRGHVTRMVVVPGRSRHSLPATTVADNGSGA